MGHGVLAERIPSHIIGIEEFFKVFLTIPKKDKSNYWEMAIIPYHSGLRVTNVGLSYADVREATTMLGQIDRSRYPSDAIFLAQGEGQVNKILGIIPLGDGVFKNAIFSENELENKKNIFTIIIKR